MLTHSDDVPNGDRPELSRLLERLAREGREWATAETALAKIEIDSLKAQAARASSWAALAFAALLCMLLAIAQALIALLSPLLGAAGGAAVVALVFAAASAGSMVMARRSARWRTESIFFRWLGARPVRSGP